MPRGDVLGTYDTYEEALAVVDRLSKAELDVSKLSIVGNDLKTVEHVTGRLTYGRAAAGGAASGAWFGLFLGVLLTLFSPSMQWGLLAAAVLIGAGAGMLFAVASFAINKRRRDFTSTHAVLASNYQVIVDPSVVAQAQALLQGPLDRS
jgi:uncharacterized membrane protein